MHAEINQQIESLQGKIEELDRKHNFDVDLVEEVLSVTRNIYKSYKDAPPNLKKHYLRFFFEKLFVENKLLVNARVSPIFAALQQEQAVIIRANWLPLKNLFLNQELEFDFSLQTIKTVMEEVRLSNLVV